MSDTPTPSQAEKAEMPTIAYLVTGLRSGEPDICFPDELEDYSNKGHKVKFEELVLRSDHESQLAEMRAEVERLRDALTVAVDHIEMDALRISHCKDAAVLDAALAADGKDGAR
jgi:hypothetical protein